jgi:nucleoside-diphosphate-sugar epimerase
LNWSGVSTVVIGGASFIGSHLVEALVRLEANVTVCDDFNSGRYENLKGCRKKIRIRKVDLREYQLAKKVLNWTPRTSFESGLTPTIDWYTHNRDREFVLQNLDRILFERDAAPDKARQACPKGTHIPIMGIVKIK